MGLLPAKRAQSVQWSSGYDFCLTFEIPPKLLGFTEGLQFDPGLNHLLLGMRIIYVDSQLHIVLSIAINMVLSSHLSNP